MCIRISFHDKRAGAAPKDIKSLSESSSFPKSLETPSFLATLPSNLSIKQAVSIKSAASSKELLLFMQIIIAIIPKDRLKKVNIFGIWRFKSILKITPICYIILIISVIIILFNKFSKINERKRYSERRNV